jgi:cell division protein FtsB
LGSRLSRNKFGEISIYLEGDCLAEQRNSETLAKQFLLGKLSSELSENFEEKLFTDDAVFEEIEITEGELVEAYVSNELSPEERERFEHTLLRLPRIAQRVEVTRLLLKKAAPPPVQIREPKVGWWSRLKAMLLPRSGVGGLTFATTTVVLLIGGSILFSDWLRLRETSKALQSERAGLEKRNQELIAERSRTTVEQDRLKKDVETARAENSKLNAENAKLNEVIEREPERSFFSTIIPLTLGVGASREPSASETLNVPATPTRVKLNLLLESDEYVSYKAVVTTNGGREIWQQSNLKPHAKGPNKIVSVFLLSTRFTSGDYMVALSGVTKSGQVDEPDYYPFRVRTTANPR